jgi:DNA (cytosine-5)-methyltransferase 1
MEQRMSNWFHIGQQVICVDDQFVLGAHEGVNVLDLFSGIGGFSLGLERAGMRTVAFCEIEPFCRARPRQALARGVPCYDDVRTLTADRLEQTEFPWMSSAEASPARTSALPGKGAGIEGERSGLWSEYARIIGELRPRYVIVENVAALLGRGLDRVLGDLAALGFDAEWHCIPASAVGAPHRRDRIWIVADAGLRLHASELVGGGNPSQAGGGQGRHQSQGQASHGQRVRSELGPSRQAVANPASERCGETRQHRERYSERPASCREILANSDRAGHEGSRRDVALGRRFFTDSNLPKFRQFETEPRVGRVVDGVPNWAHRIKSLGNAVVPQIPEIIGRAIMSAGS